MKWNGVESREVTCSEMEWGEDEIGGDGMDVDGSGWVGWV